MTFVISNPLAIYFIVALIAYLLGSIPFGLLISQAKGIDIREHGSKNIGATNVGRIVGKREGFLTLLLDFLKSFVPVVLCNYFLIDRHGLELLGLIAGFFALFGHCFPIYLGFKGGKGVATGAGVILGLCPLTLAVALPIFIAVVKISGYVSLGSMITAAIAPVIAYFICQDAMKATVIGMIGLIIIFRHKENLSRLIKGKEKSWNKNKNE